MLCKVFENKSEIIAAPGDRRQVYIRLVLEWAFTYTFEASIEGRFSRKTRYIFII